MFWLAFLDRVSQSGVTNLGIPDHQLIYCIRKTARIKSYCHKRVTFSSLKSYSTEIYEEALQKLTFPNYELFGGIDKTYENLIQKLMAVIDNLAPSENKSVKGTSKVWFDIKIMGKITERYRLFKKSC